MVLVIIIIALGFSFSSRLKGLKIYFLVILHYISLKSWNFPILLTDLDVIYPYRKGSFLRPKKKCYFMFNGVIKYMG